MIKGDTDRRRMISIEETADHLSAAGPSPWQRFGEAIPALVSWLALLAPVWLTLISPTLGIVFAAAFVAYFLVRGTLYGVRALIHRRRVAVAQGIDWLAKLQSETGDAEVDWRDCRVTFLIRAYRESNVDMLRNTIASIYSSNWPRTGGRARAVEVVFATEEHDPVTPPLVEILAAEFRDKLSVRQIRHPEEPDALPGPSSAMHYVGRIIYREARQQGADPNRWLIADLDSDTLLHPQYLPCMVYYFVQDPKRQWRVYQPMVAFTTDYWDAPLHSRLSAIGTTALTVSWQHRPEIAFTGAAASLAMLRSVDFWPTNSHSQDSGIDLRFRLRYGRRYRVVGLPLPVRVYPVMSMVRDGTALGRISAYLDSFRALFRQSARWREGPLDEFVEAMRHARFPLAIQRLWSGFERDTLTILPGYGFLVVRAVTAAFHPNADAVLFGGGNQTFNVIAAIALSVVSLLGLVVSWQLLAPGIGIVPPASPTRRGAELFLFWLVFGIYIPIATGLAGVRTATAYFLGKRPRGHFTPTPK